MELSPIANPVHSKGSASAFTREISGTRGQETLEDGKKVVWAGVRREKGFHVVGQKVLTGGGLRPFPGMPIPLGVQTSAWIRQWVGADEAPTGVEQLLLRISEQALQQGARAGLEALVEAVVRLTGTSGAALYTGARCVALRGLAPPAPESASPLQRFQEGAALLVLGEPRTEGPEREHLQRLAALGAVLLTSQAREEAARAEGSRDRHERLRLMRLLAHRERVWSRASHDLRTPLLVLQGYIEMMIKGVGGPMGPPAQRYLERMVKSAADLNARLHRFRGDVTPPEDARRILSAAFAGPEARQVQVELPPEPVHSRATASELELLMRELARLLTGAHATGARLWMELPEGSREWRLHLRAHSERAVPERTRESLERLARRWKTSLAWGQDSALELTVPLPRLD